MKKGFTLIELLAVIIILAIIALIATPIILNVVDDARKSAAVSEASMIVSGVNNHCATAAMKDQMDNTAVSICLPSAESMPNVEPAEVSQMVQLGNATVTAINYDGSKVTSLTITSNTYTVTYNSSTGEFVATK